MVRVLNTVVIVAMGLTGAFAVLNWQTLLADAPLNLVIARIQAPLGIVLLGLAAVLTVLFLIAYLRHQIVSLLETRKLIKEMQRLKEVADTAETSRIERLRIDVMREFELLNERLSARPEPLPAGGSASMPGVLLGSAPR